MRKPAILIWAAVCLIDLSGCGTTSITPPLVTPELTRGRIGQRADIATLREGRALFVSRCIECHTLPPISSHSAVEWPRLVGEMAGRANLKPTERNALLAYILTVRAQ
jgi:mono/diheme cytochrome c family protein